MPDAQQRASLLDMRAPPQHPVAQRRGALRRHFTRCLEPALHQGTLQGRPLWSGAPLAGCTLDAITLLGEGLDGRACRTRPQGHTKAFVAPLMPVDEFAYLIILRLHRITADAPVVAEREPYRKLRIRCVADQRAQPLF